MSTLQKVKAYFGMVPLDDIEDGYYDEPAHPNARSPYYEDEVHNEYDRSRYYQPAPVPAYDNYRPLNQNRARFNTNPPSGAIRLKTRGDLAIAGYEESGPLSQIKTIKPRDYSEARIIGENYRDGIPVIMDLAAIPNSDAKRLVDFAAGLAFALQGTFDKVASKVFLLSPPDVNVSAEDRKKIAETGFYSRDLD